jgi:hypothetical protein
VTKENDKKEKYDQRSLWFKTGMEEALYKNWWWVIDSEVVCESDMTGHFPRR